MSDNAGGCLSRETINAYHARDLGDDEFTYAQEHLRRCPTCAASSSKLLAECEQVIDRLKHLKDESDDSARGPSPSNQFPGDESPPFELDGDTTQTVEGGTRAPRYPEVPGYRIVGVLGQGGMGIVYEAVQEKLSRRVALKLLPRVISSAHRTLVQRFRREATAAAKLHHSNIVPIFDFGESHAGYYYAMEILDGQSMGSIIKRVAAIDTPVATPTEIASLVGVGGTASAEHLIEMDNTPTSTQLDASLTDSTSDSRGRTSTGKSKLYYYQVAKWVADIADALHYAHLKGMIHRDVKPANIMVCQDGRVVLVDFGLVKESADESVTMTGSLLGTYRYMSPEQIGAKRIKVDARTDVYSLGATLYEVLTLQPAFVAAEQSELLGQILWREPVPPRKLAPSVPIDMQTICLKAMQKSPAERYASAGDMANDLRQFLGDMPIKARPVGPIGRTTRYLRRHPLATGLSSVILMLMIALGLSSTLLTKAEEKQYAAEKMQRVAEEQRFKVTLDKAWELVRNEEWESAAAAYREVLGDNPNNLRALINFAYMLKNQHYADGNKRWLKEALALANRAVLLDPERAGAWNAKTIALRELGRYEEALEACNAAPSAGRNSWAILVNKGGLLAAMGDLVAGKELLAESIRLAESSGKNPDFLALRNLAAIQLALGDSAAWTTLEEAGKYAGKAIAGIDSLEALMQLRVEAHRDPQLALERASSADRMSGEDHRNVGIIRVLALARLLNGDYDRAAISARRVLELTKDADKYAGLILAVALAKDGDLQGAIRLRSLLAKEFALSDPQPEASCTLESRMLWCHTQSDLDALRHELDELLGAATPSLDSPGS